MKPASVFYQFVAKDRHVPPLRPTDFYDATKSRKLMATYEADHDLTPARAWLAQELGLK